MSLLGIDVGSSSVKAAAYRGDGTLLGSVKAKIQGRWPRPGWWESNPAQVWSATLDCLRELSAAAKVRRDPPVVLAISASGREAFPVDAAGRPLGPCLMAGDIRGADIETEICAKIDPQESYRACGHLPERMDPLCRLLWWRREHPETMQRAERFLGWHEFLALRLCGVAATDHSLAGKWLAYDLESRAWSRRRLRMLGVEDALLPEIADWGVTIGKLRTRVARRCGLPVGMRVAVGAFDCLCASLGAGVAAHGEGGLLCGSWADLIVPAAVLPPIEVARAGMPTGPCPGPAPLAVQVLTPNGTVVLDWALRSLRVSIRGLNRELGIRGNNPGPVIAIPHFSGAAAPWHTTREPRGALYGLSLATAPGDMVKALLEGIVFDIALSLDALRATGLGVERLRAAGGGTRLAWWMQLYADLCGVPIDVAGPAEAGTLGAALLAGVATGTWSAVEQAAECVTKVRRRYRPCPARAAQYRERLAAYRAGIAAQV